MIKKVIWKENLTTKSWERCRAFFTTVTSRACWSLFVHLAINKVPIGSIVAGVQGGKPPTILVRRRPTPNFISASPHQCCVVTGGAAEPERLDVLVAEQGDLLVPVGHGFVPVIIWG